VHNAHLALQQSTNIIFTYLGSARTPALFT